MFTIKEKRALDKTEGWLWASEGLRLAELAAQVPKTHWIVELGSHLGRSSGYLAAGARKGKGAKLVCIDAWGGEGRLETFKSNMERLEVLDQITIVQAMTEDAFKKFNKKKKIGLLFIDAEHLYDPTLREYQEWSPLIPIGGWLAFHDSRHQEKDWPDVERVVADHVTPSGEWEAADYVETLWTGKRIR